MSVNNKLSIEKLTTMLNATFHGGAWHGSSILELTKGLNAKEAAFKTGSVHTIAELIYHITSWRIFAIKKIQGDKTYLIEGDKMNWGNFHQIDQFELETLMMEMTLSQDELIKELEAKTDEFLDEIVPGTEYSYWTLINGIIHHDLYHGGQIAILKKMASKGSKSDSFGDFEGSSRFFEDDEFEDDLI